MHELSLAHQLLTRINELAEENGLSRVRKVGVLVEGATGESLEPLAAAFELAAQDTPAASASLVFEEADASAGLGRAESAFEAGIRAYDPCLSCSTHAIGTMPLVVELVAFDGKVLDQAVRE